MWTFNVSKPLGQTAGAVCCQLRCLHPVRWALVLSVLAGSLQGCGGGSDSAANISSVAKMQSTQAVASAADQAATLVPVLQPAQPIPDTPATGVEPVPKRMAAPIALAQSVQALAAPAALLPDPGLLLMLVPDGQDLTDPRISAWQDAASEEGIRLQPITDTQFLSLGAAATAYAGLILPDSLHTRASDALIDAIRTYTQNKGKTMLVYDFGALTPAGFYPASGASRLSDLAGVQYIRYAELLNQTTGLGPVRALRQTMRSLLVPPGKSLPYVEPVVAPATLAKAISPTDTVNSVVVSDSLQGAAGVTSSTALYLPVDTTDPGGVKGYDPQQFMALG